MILEFLDGKQISVRDIFGGPRLVRGTMRDTLKIEVDTAIMSFDDLKSCFKNNPNTSKLYTYDDNGEKTEIGEGYKIFVSITDEERTIAPTPGKIAPDMTEEIYVVQIAQQTYQEFMDDPSNNHEEG